MWKPGDAIAWRGIAAHRPWHIQSVIVVKDAPDEIAVLFLPGAECVAEKGYASGEGKNGRRRWDFKDNEWELIKYSWQRNRVLALVQPEKYYSIMHFWNHAQNKFIGYYVNFQLPFRRSHCGIDTLDLELDLDIEPDLSFQWKDVEDYQKAIEHGFIAREWTHAIETAKPEIFEKLEKHQYPFDGSWLDWMPDPTWTPPRLPTDWDKVSQSQI